MITGNVYHVTMRNQEDADRLIELMDGKVRAGPLPMLDTQHHFQDP